MFGAKKLHLLRGFPNIFRVANPIGSLCDTKPGMVKFPEEMGAEEASFPLEMTG
jgi:hypothetical protein